jgi:hypothetical protein
MLANKALKLRNLRQAVNRKKEGNRNEVFTN